MTWPQGFLLFFAALVGGGINSIAGGGSVITFPALIFAGVLPIQANATSTMALLPGSAASVVGYRREIAQQQHWIVRLGIPSFIGGLTGAALLLHTSQHQFSRLVPWLILAATILFALQGPVMRLISRHMSRDDFFTPGLAWPIIAGIQLVVSIYGGFFGAGIGIAMLSALGLLGLRNIHEMNGLKVVLGVLINGVAIVYFALAGVIVWPIAAIMAAGAIIGGYAGSSMARRTDGRIVRLLVVAIGFGLSLVFFLRRA